MRFVIVVGILLSLLLLGIFSVAAGADLLTEESTRTWLRELLERDAGRSLVALAIFGLLAGDLLLPVPSIPVMIVAGGLLGTFTGGLVAGTGCFVGSLIGFLLCRWGGRGAYRRFVSGDEAERIRVGFRRYGVLLLIVGRLFPIVPEVVACLAGLTRLPPRIFVPATALGSFPIAFALSAAGATSVEWALAVGVGLPLVAWLLLRHTITRATSDRDADDDADADTSAK